MPDLQGGTAMSERATYAISRGHTLDAALERFRARFGCNPIAVVVNVGLIEQTTAALIHTGLDVPVTSNGGVLLGELWLQRPAVDMVAEAIRPHSLAWRADRARRTAGPMSVERARQLALALESELSEV
jgi:hypothetical protein